MHDARVALAGEVGRLNRRQAFGAIVGGTLFGSAWAALFRHAVLADDEVQVSVARTATALGALIVHRGHRVLLIDAGDSAGVDSVTELAAGFLLQRIDNVIVPASAARHLSRAFRDRWRVRDIWTVPDLPGTTGQSLAGRSLRVGELRIVADCLPRGAWRGDAPATSPWYATASYGRTRLTVASDGSALDRLPLDPSMINAVMCGTIESPEALVRGIDILAMPVDAVGDVPNGPRVVPLSSGTPVAFRLRQDAIELPGTG